MFYFSEMVPFGFSLPVSITIFSRSLHRQTLASFRAEDNTKAYREATVWDLTVWPFIRNRVTVKQDSRPENEQSLKPWMEACVILYVYKTREERKIGLMISGKKMKMGRWCERRIHKNKTSREAKRPRRSNLDGVGRQHEGSLKWHWTISDIKNLPCRKFTRFLSVPAAWKTKLVFLFSPVS